MTLNVTGALWFLYRMDNCSLTRACCESLAPALSSDLSQLILSQNDLQDSGVKLLSAGLETPDCKLEILRSGDLSNQNKHLYYELNITFTEKLKAVYSKGNVHKKYIKVCADVLINDLFVW